MLAIQGVGRQLRIANLELPNTMIAGDVSRKLMPANATGAQVSANLSPFNFFRLAPNNANSVQANVTPNIPSTGAIVASGIGQVASTATDYLLKQRLQQQSNPVVAGDFTNPGTIIGTGNKDPMVSGNFRA